MFFNNRRINLMRRTTSLFLSAAVAVFFVFLSCDNPTVGLGNKVDLAAPVVKINAKMGPGPGSFLSGTKRVFVSASDDNGIASVTVTCTYNTAGPENKLIVHPPVSMPARLDPASGEYFVDINTAGMADGPLTVELTAVDVTGKTTKSDKIIYTVKNAPPALDLQVPRPRQNGGILNNTDSPTDPLPVVITGSYLMGIYQDLAGVAEGYPQIQLWADADGSVPPPAADTENAGWKDVILDDGANDGWIPVDQGLTENAQGEKGNTFRYYLRDHNADGSPMEEGTNPLSQGKYSLRIKVRDILGKELIWPDQAYEGSPDRIRMELSAIGTPPLVTITAPKEQSWSGNFTISAKAEATGDIDRDIAEIWVEISGKNKAGETKTVTLGKWTNPGNNIIKDFPIEIGKTWYNMTAGSPLPPCDNEAGVPSDAFSFITLTDGSYTFIVRALSAPTGSQGRQEINLYIDRIPPAVSITGVTPAFSQDKANGAEDGPNNNPHTGSAPDPYRRWTVNSTVKIGVSSMDNRGSALEQNGDMKFKYLLLPDNDIDENDFTGWKNQNGTTNFGQYLFNRADAEYFDKTKRQPVPLTPPVQGNNNPLIKVEGGDGAYTMTLQTHHYAGNPDTGKYRLWMYIVSEDNAGNFNYDKILLRVDQTTDNPVVKFGGPFSGGSTFADETLNIQVEISDDDGFREDTVKYRFAKKDDPDDNNIIWSAWYVLNTPPPQGLYTSLTRQLALKKIYADLSGGSAFDTASREDREQYLGSEEDTKVIQVQAKDDVENKVLQDTDGIKEGSATPTRFTIDFAWPEIVPSVTDANNNPIPVEKKRTDDNPFAVPEKDTAWKTAFTAYGDIIEKNPLSLTVIIDGSYSANFPVPDSIPGSEPPMDNDNPVPAIWKTGSGLRWRFPMNWEVPATGTSPAYRLWDKIAASDGSHTFTLQVTDKAARTVSRQITFYTDINGPAINLISPNSKVHLDDTELENIGNNNIDPALQQKLDALKQMTIRETEAKIIGTFTDAYSNINGHFWYRIDKGPWTRKDFPASPAPGKTAAWEIAFISVARGGAGEITDGLHRLSIRVADNLSNGHGYDPSPYSEAGPGPANGYGAETFIGFILDRKDPELLIRSPYADRDLTETVEAYTGGNLASGTGEVIRVSGLAADSSLPSNPIRASIDQNAPDTSRITLAPVKWHGPLPAAPASLDVDRWHAYYNTANAESFLTYGNGGTWESLYPEDPAYGKDMEEGVELYLWTFILDKNGLDAVPAEGRHSITFTVKDSTGREETKVWNFIKDNTPPAIEILNGKPGNTDKPVIMTEDDPVIRGTASDISGKVTAVGVKLEHYAYAAGETPPYKWETIQSGGSDWEDLGITAGSTASWAKDLGAGGADLEDGRYRISVKALDNTKSAGNSFETTPFEFIIDRNNPVLGGPAPDTGIIKRFYNKDFVISSDMGTPGNTGDDQPAIDKNKITISAKIGSTAIPADRISVTQEDADRYSWTVTVPLSQGTAENSWSVTVTAADPAGRTDTATWNFTYDKTPPNSAFTAPGTGIQKEGGSLGNGTWGFVDDPGTWINGIVDIRGTSDDKNGVGNISYHLGKLPGNTEADYTAADWTDTLLHTTAPRTGWTGGLYNWTYTDNFNAYETVPSMIEPVTGRAFRLPLYIRTEDMAGNIRILRYTLQVDPDLDKPQVSIANPSDNTVVGGEVRVSGTAMDDDWVYGVQIRIKNNRTNTYHKDPADSFITPGTITNNESNWVWARIIGNTDKVTAWYYNINSDGSLDPAPGDTTPVTIEARAVDTREPSHQIAAETGSSRSINIQFDSNVPTIGNIKIEQGSGIRDYTAGIRAGGAFTITADIQDEGGISSIMARETGDSGYRSMLVNPKNEWSVEPPVLENASAWSSGYKYFITDPGTITNWADFDALYTSTKQYEAGTMIKYMKGAAAAPSGSATAYRAEGSPATTGSADDPAYNTQFFIYSISVEVNSTNFYNYGNSGYYNLELQVADNNASGTAMANYMTQAGISVMIDNFYPTASFTTQRNASTKNFYISGTARDFDDGSGNVQGLERILVYFERDGVYMNAKGIPNTGMTAYPQGKEGTAPANSGPGGLSNFPLLRKEGNTWKSDHAMVIDNLEFGEDKDSDGDGTYAEVFEGTTVKTWQARFDTTELPDGPITIHYVIMDLAGNATHYTRPAYIRNNPPIIREFNLGTDLDGDGQIKDWEYNKDSFIVAEKNGPSVDFKKTGAIQTDFTVRNSQLRFTLNTLDGNKQKHYKISHVRANDSDDELVESTALMAGEVYTISASPGNTDWKRLGAPNNFPGTTFAASGPAPAFADNGDESSGKAISYTPVGAEKADDFAVDDSRPSGYSDNAAAIFSGSGPGGDFEHITDSITGSSTALQHNRLFIIKVYDTTIQGGTGSQQLAHAVLLNLDTDNVDETRPVVKVSPFYWKNASENSLYENNRAYGHIELETDLPPAFVTPDDESGLDATGRLMDRDPKVSGQISIRGSAEDNSILKTLWIYLDGFDFTGGTGISSTTIGARTYALAASYLGSEQWESADQWGSKGWKFTVDTGTQVHDQTGHRVNWRLDIDTAKIAGTAETNRVFRILAGDAVNNSEESDTQTAAGAETPRYRMDVVPYITELETRLSAFNRSAPSVYARTALGKYTAAENDDITVYGFNFGSPVITLNGAGMTVQEQGNGTGARAPWSYAKINAGTANGGPLAVIVNGLSSLNNINNNGAEINGQPNSVNNNNLTDDTAVDIWQFTQVFKAQSESRYPTMKVGPSGQIGFSFANDYRWFNMPGYSTPTGSEFQSQTIYQKGWGGYSHNTFAFDAKGNTYGAATNIDEAGYDKSANFSFMNRRSYGAVDSMMDPDNYEGSFLNTMRLENTALPSGPSSSSYIVDVNRIQSPVMTTSLPRPEEDINNTDNRVSVYMAYYDRTTKQVRFRAGTVGANRSAGQGSDFMATIATTNDVISVDSHGLQNGTQVYIRSDDSKVTADKTRPYYVIDALANSFSLSQDPGGTKANIATGSGTAYISVSVTGGGLVDLSGFVAAGENSRITPADAKPSSYQTVAASGEYNPGATITYQLSGGVPGYSTTYPGATNYGPGAHIAIGVVKRGADDVVVLAWYDEVHNQLIYSWNDDPSGNSAGNWQTNARVIDDYAGEGVSLAVDSDKGIHLAYHSSNGADLRYAYAGSYNGDFTTVTVDSYLSVGTHSTIAVAKDNAGRQVPHISYYAAGASALRARMACRNYDTVPGDPAVAGADGMDRFTGAWEVTIVPTTKTPSEYRISIGVYTDGNGKIAAIPTGPDGKTVVEGTGYGNGIPVNPPTRLYGNGTLNPVVGYGTTTNLEMAQKK
jgi:hypothetical protein